jgi:hypothetical protein
MLKAECARFPYSPADLTEPFSPVAWSPFGVHDGDDPDAVRFVEINHRIRELAGQCALRGWTESEEAIGLIAHFPNEPFDFIVRDGRPIQA